MFRIPFQVSVNSHDVAVYFVKGYEDIVTCTYDSAIDTMRLVGPFGEPRVIDIKVYPRKLCGSGGGPYCALFLVHMFERQGIFDPTLCAMCAAAGIKDPNVGLLTLDDNVLDHIYRHESS